MIIGHRRSGLPPFIGGGNGLGCGSSGLIGFNGGIGAIVGNVGNPLYNLVVEEVGALTIGGVIGARVVPPGPGAGRFVVP